MSFEPPPAKARGILPLVMPVGTDHDTVSLRPGLLWWLSGLVGIDGLTWHFHRLVAASRPFPRHLPRSCATSIVPRPGAAVKQSRCLIKNLLDGGVVAS